MQTMFSIKNKIGFLLGAIQFIEGTEMVSEPNLNYQKNSMDESIADILEESANFHPRQFFLAEFPAVNATTTFTFPIFHFTIPGIEDNSTDIAAEGKPFGVLAFIALYLIGIIGILVNSVIQKWIPNNGNFAGRSFEGNYQKSTLDHFYELTDGLPEVLDFENCAKLSICEAYARSETYGLLAWAIQLFIPITDHMYENELTEYEKAAVFGYGDDEECHYKYQCLLQPMDLAILAKDYLLTYFEST